MNTQKSSSRRATFCRAITHLVALSVIFANLVQPLAASQREINAETNYLVTTATCSEIVPIISGAIREPLLKKEFADTLTSILPPFIYGYALAKQLSFDEARFELIENCKDNSDKPFAGFPSYQPDPAFWPEAFIILWEEAQKE